MKILLLRLDFD